MVYKIVAIEVRSLSLQEHSQMKELMINMMLNPVLFSYQGIFLNFVLDYGNIIYDMGIASILKPLESIFHSPLCFIRSDRRDTHHCNLH